MSSIGCFTAAAAETEQGIDEFSIETYAAGQSVPISSWYVRSALDYDITNHTNQNVTGTFSSTFIVPLSSTVTLWQASSFVGTSYVDTSVFSLDMFFLGAEVYDNISLSGSVSSYFRIYTSDTLKSSFACTSVDLIAVSFSGESVVNHFIATGSTVSFSGSYSLPADCSSVFLRFNYPSNKHNGFSIAAGSSSTSARIDVTFSSIPSASVTTTDSSWSLLGAIKSLASSILDAVSALVGSQFVAPPQQAAAASQYVKDMGELQDQIDEANQTIEDNTNRPSADALVPATPDIIQDGVIGGGDAAATAMMDDFGSLLASPLILNVLVFVFTLAFLSYVLFGKKG